MAALLVRPREDVQPFVVRAALETFHRAFLKFRQAFIVKLDIVAYFAEPDAIGVREGSVAPPVARVGDYMFVILVAFAGAVQGSRAQGVQVVSCVHEHRGYGAVAYVVVLGIVVGQEIEPGFHVVQKQFLRCILLAEKAAETCKR